MLNRVSLIAVACFALLASASAAAAGAPARDPLDAPATKSPLAARALLNGLARAGDRVIAVGQRGHVLYSDDDGKSWKQADVPVSSDLVAVSFPTAKAGWAVGHDGVVLHSTDAGATWSRQLDGRAVGALLVDHYTHAARSATAADAKRADALVAEAKRFAAQGADAPLLDVWFVNESTGYIVGAFGLILKTSDGGARWEPWLHAVDNPKSLHFYAVRAIAGDLYLAGEQGLLLKLDPAAQRFRALELPYQGTLFGITGTSSAVIVHGLRGTVLRSTERGRDWQPVRTGLQVGLTSSTVDASGRIVIVSQAGHVLASRDGGATFTAVPVERPMPAAAVVAARDALVVAGPRGVHALPAR
jgi:photosystem II stability/assembly factor-like uncharacterized protein